MTEHSLPMPELERPRTEFYEPLSGPPVVKDMPDIMYDPIPSKTSQIALGKEDLSRLNRLSESSIKWLRRS